MTSKITLSYPVALSVAQSSSQPISNNSVAKTERAITADQVSSSKSVALKTMRALSSGWRKM